MTNYKYLLILFVLLFGNLFGPNFYIAGISLRVLTTLFGIVLLFFQRKNVLMNNVFFIFILYILYYIFISMINGSAYEEYFVKGILNWFLPSILLFLLVPCYIDSGEKMKNVCYLIICLSLFNVLVSIGEFFNLSIAWDIGNTINAHAAETSELYMERHDISMGLMGLSIVNGICSSVVDNGYFIATAFPLLFCITKTNAIFPQYKTIVFFLIILTASASLLIQQRMGFYLITLFVIYHLWVSLHGYGRILLITLAVLIFFSAEYWLNSIDLGRIAEAGDKDRAETYIDSVLMIFKDARLFCLGGESYYREFFRHVPHNTLIGAWIYCGVIGFLIFAVMVVQLLQKLLPSFIGYKSRNNIVQYSLAACCLIFLAYSMTHSTGLHNGKGLYFWLFYGLYLKYDYMYVGKITTYKIER